MKPRHAAALALVGWYFACCLTGCGVSTQMTGARLDEIKPGMTREQVIAKFGQPVTGCTVRGVLSNDNYNCNVQGEIMVISYGQEFTIWPLGALLNKDAMRKLAEQSRECVVKYGKQGRVVSTAQLMGRAS
jgi:hypothetical protein